MYKASESMKELHKIRKKMYEEMKHMSSKERVAAINKAAEEIERKYGLHLRKAEKHHVQDKT